MMEMHGKNLAPGFANHPQHEVRIVPANGPVIVHVGNQVVAETSNALKVRETGYEEVIYIPEEGMKMECFKRSGHTSYCPFKGEANYLTLEWDGRMEENIAWGYHQPYDEAAALKGHWAFFADRVTIDAG